MSEPNPAGGAPAGASVPSTAEPGSAPGLPAPAPALSDHGYNAVVGDPGDAQIGDTKIGELAADSAGTVADAPRGPPGATQPNLGPGKSALAEPAGDPGVTPGALGGAIAMRTYAEQPQLGPGYENFGFDRAVVDEVRKLFDIGARSNNYEDAFNRLLKFGVERERQLADAVQRHNRDVWDRHQEQWIGQLKNDPELGGDRLQVTLGEAKYAFVHHLGLDAGQQQELLRWMDASGLSNHPLMIRGLRNLYQKLAPPQPVYSNPPRQQPPGGRDWYGAIDEGAR